MAVHLTKDELLAYLKKSNLNTILVEGKDDASIYRWIEEDMSGEFSFDLLPCHGRDTLIDIYKERHDITNIKLVFIADKDKYVYLPVPEEYNEILWTSGYSIENDLYYGGYLESLLTSKEKDDFMKALTNFIDYYSHDIEKIKNGENPQIDYHPNRILDDNFDLLLGNSSIYNTESTKEELLRSYQLLIRGKSLFSLLFLLLCNSKRPVKHKKDALMEICLRCNDNNLVKNIIQKIKERLKSE